MPEENKEVEKEIEDKEKPKPFWERVHPFWLIAGMGLVYLALTSMFMTEEGGTNYLFLIIIVGIILFFLAKKEEPRAGIIKPHEAEFLVKREMDRKRRAKQIPLMNDWEIGLVNNMLYRDGRGLHYLIGTILTNPYGGAEYPLAKVMANGDTRGFVTFIESDTQFTGRDVQDIKDIVHMPESLRLLKDHPQLASLWGK